MTALKSLDTALQEGLERLEQADGTARLEFTWVQWDGVLHGYYLAGGASQVEVKAAQAELRRTYNAVHSHALFAEQWRAANPEEAPA